jgi:heme-degrading monooxygenase HmoA
VVALTDAAGDPQCGRRLSASPRKSFEGRFQCPRPVVLVFEDHPKQGKQLMSEAKFPLSRRSVVVAGVAAAGATLIATLAHSQTRSKVMQATIRVDGSVITLVNVFTVEQGKLPSLLDVLRDGTDTFFSKMPGFVSSSVLTGKDGRQAINYSQWRSADDIAAFRKDPRFAPYIQRLLALAKAEGIECTVAYVNAT